MAKRSYWKDCFAVDGEEIVDEMEVSVDGLMIRLPLELVDKYLSEYEYDKSNDSWWFNKSHDRYIAERDSEGKVYANPQLLWRRGLQIVS